MSLGGKRTEDQIRHDLEFFCGTIGITLDDEHIKDIEASISNESRSGPSVPDFIKDPHQKEIYKLLLDSSLSDDQLRSLALMRIIPMSERLLNLTSADHEEKELGGGAYGVVHHNTVSYSYGALSFATFNDEKLQPIINDYYSGDENAYNLAKTRFNEELKDQSQPQSKRMLKQDYVKKTSIGQEKPKPRKIGSAEHEEAIHQSLISELRQQPTGPLKETDLINTLGTAILQGEVWKLRSLANDTNGTIQKLLFEDGVDYKDMFEPLYQLTQALQYEENLEEACNKTGRTYTQDESEGSAESKIKGFENSIMNALVQKFKPWMAFFRIQKIRSLKKEFL